MAVTTLPTFTPSGYAVLTTALLPSPSYTTFSGIALNNPALAAVPTAIALPSGSTPATVLLENLGPDPAAVLIATAAATTTATQATVGAKTIVVASATSIAVGQVVVAVGIQPGTLVTAIASTTISISQPTTAALSSAAVNFVTAVTLTTGIACDPHVPLALAYVSSGFLSALCFNSASRSIIDISVGV